MASCYLLSKDAARFVSKDDEKCSFNMQTYRTCTSIARIITGVFSEMNFSEDVYAKGSKDTFARRLTRLIRFILWMAGSQGRELRVRRRTGYRITKILFSLASVSGIPTEKTCI